MPPVRRFILRLLSHVRVTRAERELSREVESHLRLLEDTYLAQGMTAIEARQAARRAFGGVEQAKEHQRDARSFRWLTGWSMDLKLGARMAIKYPGLTVIAVIALSLAIGAGAAYMEFVTDLLHPTLSFKGADRVVGIVNWDIVTGESQRRALSEFAQWRGQLRTVEDLGAAFRLQRNLITDDGRSEPVRGAEVTASAFRIVPASPLMGRGLTDDDERGGAAPVAVIGEDLWRNRFGSDPLILGRAVRLGSAPYTIVGVMPRSFAFPVNQSMWVPLRVAPAQYARGDGPEVVIFGRLAEGAAPDAAQSELAALSGRLDSALPQTAPRLRPVVKPYVASLWSASADGELQRYILYGANLLFVGLLGICGANVATLVFARTLTREAEITVRTALGASRGRIVSQLVAEALVLSSVAAIAGLAVASFAGRWAKAKFVEAQQSVPPFWWSDELSPETLVYAAVLAVLAALLVGGVPALKATGPRMQARLKSAGSSGPSMRFGGMWTAVVIGQVTVTVLFLMTVVSVAVNASVSPYAAGNFAFEPAEYVTVQLDIDRENQPGDTTVAGRAAASARLGSTLRELERRLELDPSVAAVTQTTRVPGGGNEFILEFDPQTAGGARPDAGRSENDPLWVRSALVGHDFFDTFGAPIVAGRAFTAAEAEQVRAVAIVDETFVRMVMRGRDPVGMRIRQQRRDGNEGAPQTWYEIVGVVRDLGTRPGKSSEDAMLYRPAVAGATPWQFFTIVRARGNAASLPATVRRIAAEADPTLRLTELMPLSDYYRVQTIGYAFFLRALAAVSAVALLLSSAGIYALMSFTLSRRTREIGIRSALGAAPRRIVTTVFSRAFTQIGAGLLVGCVPGYLLVAQGAPEVARAGGSFVGVLSTLAVCAFVGSIAALACLGPARRALRIHPTEALRTE